MTTFPRFTRPASITVGLIICVSLSACVSVLPEPKPAPTVYRLSVPAISVQSVPVKAIVINIEYPKAPKALGGTDVILSPDGRRLTAASGASWSEPVPSMLRNILIDTLAGRGGVKGIIPNGNTRVPYRLNMDIRRFEAVFYQGAELAPTSVIQLNLSLVDTATRTIISSYSVFENVRASAKTVSAIVDAKDEASHMAMGKIAVWLDGQLRENPLIAQ